MDAIALKVNGIPQPLKLHSLQVYATITGFTSETTAFMSFSNETQRVLEGELTFPLPTVHQTLCRND